MDNRLDADNAKKMLSSLGSNMEPEMWKRMIVVLTFANFFVFQLENGYQDFTEEAIKLQVERETEEFRQVFQEHTGKDNKLVSQIPFILAGSMKQRKLPTDDDWLVTLWDQKRHDERSIQSSAEQSVGANSEEQNGQGVPGQQEGQVQNVPLADDDNSLEQEEEEMSEPRDDDSDLREDPLEHMDCDLLSEITFAMPKFND
uniref:Uncharacterized protein n=1 Tax=Amphimedon queenslandica TaxID=400682 RepID=A0A1X7V3X0_AMPQE